MQMCDKTWVAHILTGRVHINLLMALDVKLYTLV